MAIPFLCRPGAGTKPTRNRHEMSRDGTETFLDSSLLFFYTGLKYLVPAQAIIIGFKIVENCSWDVPGHVSCRPGNFRPVQTGLKIIILFICFCAGARSTWSWHEMSQAVLSHADLRNGLKKCGHGGKLLHIYRMYTTSLPKLLYIWCPC